jgi:hypothetical protein
LIHDLCAGRLQFRQRHHLVHQADAPRFLRAERSPVSA